MDADLAAQVIGGVVVSAAQAQATSPLLGAFYSQKATTAGRVSRTCPGAVPG